MPYKVTKGAGPKPYKIRNVQTGQIVGASKTKAKADASVRARMAAEKRTRR